MGVLSVIARRSRPVDSDKSFKYPPPQSWPFWKAISHWTINIRSSNLKGFLSFAATAECLALDLSTKPVSPGRASLARGSTSHCPSYLAMVSSVPSFLAWDLVHLDPKVETSSKWSMKKKSTLSSGERYETSIWTFSTCTSSTTASSSSSSTTISSSSKSSSTSACAITRAAETKKNNQRFFITEGGFNIRSRQIES